MVSGGAPRLHAGESAVRGAEAGQARSVPMTDEAGFLRAVVADPADDAPRLVYADWLDDHGQPERAEFIRVQCELARTPADDPRRLELEARERALLGVQEERWVGPLRGWVNAWEF